MIHGTMVTFELCSGIRRPTRQGVKERKGNDERTPRCWPLSRTHLRWTASLAQPRST